MSGNLVVITADGTVQEVAVSAKGPGLELLQAKVGGYIELIKVRWEERTRDAYVDEDGISKNLTHNAKASALAINGHTIFGPMVIWVPDPKVKPSTGGDTQ